jgi:hypothetical protein
MTMGTQSGIVCTGTDSATDWRIASGTAPQLNYHGAAQCARRLVFSFDRLETRKEFDACTRDAPASSNDVEALFVVLGGQSVAGKNSEQAMFLSLEPRVDFADVVDLVVPRADGSRRGVALRGRHELH